MNTGKKNLIEKWRQLIPEIECVPGCTECCSITPPFSDWEWKQTGIEGDLEMASPCRFLKDHRCTIHEHRPIICRLFGTVAMEHKLKCHSGVKGVKFLSAAKADEIMRVWVALTKKSKCFTDDKHNDMRRMLKDHVAQKFNLPTEVVDYCLRRSMR